MLRWSWATPRSSLAVHHMHTSTWDVRTAGVRHPRVAYRGHPSRLLSGPTENCCEKMYRNQKSSWRPAKTCPAQLYRRLLSKSRRGARPTRKVDQINLIIGRPKKMKMPDNKFQMDRSQRPGGVQRSHAARHSSALVIQSRGTCVRGAYGKLNDRMATIISAL